MESLSPLQKIITNLITKKTVAYKSQAELPNKVENKILAERLAAQKRRLRTRNCGRGCRLPKTADPKL